MKHRYQITVNELEGTPSHVKTDKLTIIFEANSHDDWHEIIKRAQQMGIFDEESAVAFAVGLKLFGGVMLAHRDQPLFATLAPQFGEFMRTLKGKN
jgi:hypothetical protein